MTQHKIKPDYLFECSWEVCNKVGGIYTVLSSRVKDMSEGLNDNYIFIGPDVWNETSVHPDFAEDSRLFPEWKVDAETKGLRIRIGRWKVPGSPIAVLVDFTPFFAEKDKIFASFWETYQLDSIHGGWDYIEPALFGYAAGKVIESFYNFHVSADESIIAHFHEWMTGAGVLYLKENTPQIGTVFTTHATMLGRSIAGNNLPLYGNLKNYNGKEMAGKLGVASKFSLEQIAGREADSFTTVSEITAIECELLLGKKPDVVTPNGFSDAFIPGGSAFKSKRTKSRNQLIKVAEGLLNQKLNKDSILVLTSGRYEFKNKGLDLFIDALGQTNQSGELKKEIIAFITVPGNAMAASKKLVESIKNPDFDNPKNREFLSHDLYSNNSDPVLNAISENNITNALGQKVKIIFVPVYLNGNDGIFNMDYYELLPGFDLTLFPSYYEPWGYTPLESIAFRIPTITTSVSGFGRWVESNFNIQFGGITVIPRTDVNDEDVTRDLKNTLLWFASLTDEEVEKSRNEASRFSKKLLWKHLIGHYYEAYKIALEKVDSRSGLFKSKQSVILKEVKNGISERPEWKKILVKPLISEELAPLHEIAMNLWWTWNYEARQLFESIDLKLWENCEHNPVAFIDGLSLDQLKSLRSNPDYKSRLQKVYADFKSYMNEEPEHPENQIAYFSMEYGLHESVKIYSGGLGILAGDYLKQASDSNVNLVGVGLMYRYGYFNQSLSIFGDQKPEYIPQKFTHLPLIPVRDENGNWIEISIAFPGRTLFAKAWLLNVGRIKLYLLDTDINRNNPEDRKITHQLYGGDWENRFKQELVLGVGGIRFLKELGLRPDIYHLNEGHAAFAGLERLRYLVQDRRLEFKAAVEVVRGSSLFTTHTPVPAGHDTFTEDILRTYIHHYADRLQISWEEFMGLGRFDRYNSFEKFSMSVLAAKLSQEMNGVSRIHGRVSREMFSGLFPGYFPEELHISYVTNGIHLPTWAADDWQDLYKKTLGEKYVDDQSNPKMWEKINKLGDNVVWATRKATKERFLAFLKKKLKKDLTLRQESPAVIFKSLEGVESNALYIGFARRFATYKRAHLLFTNLEKLNNIVNDPDRPVRFVFAGKAHPNDIPGQHLIKRVVEISKTPDFIGKIFFIENYDMNVGRQLVSGVDVWMNTPTRPLEASGTSGEKAVMNGVLNLSVLDGWWAEGYRENAGWAVDEARTYGNQGFQDELDAETIYRLIEDELTEAYFNVNKEGVPVEWVKFIKNNLVEIAPHFTMKRMMDDYFDRFYNKLIDRNTQMKDSKYLQAKQISKWKNEISLHWSQLEVVSVKVPDSSEKPLNLGDKFIAEVVINTNNIPIENIGMDVVFGHKNMDVVSEIVRSERMKASGKVGKNARFTCSITLSGSGVYDYAFRIFPIADFLPHQQDFNLVKWV
jgi:phosphorylase/glycogen(starch) synthase